MNKSKETLITGFALFSLFFGAGNLILPPFLGFNAGEDWIIVALGFLISGVLLPIMAIFAHARLQGTMFDFAKKVSPVFSVIYCLCVYIISITLPSPRTASVTHEIAIAPFFGTTSWLTSTIYFILVLLFVLNRSKILDILGRILTPLIIGILLLIIGMAVFAPYDSMTGGNYKLPLVSGLIEGYQTFDAIGGVVVGGVLIISLNLKGFGSFKEKKSLITKAGLLAGTGLFLIYTGLILTGALFGNEFSPDATRIEVLTGISNKTLGAIGTSLLSVLVSLACFTTAVGIVTGTADYFKGLFKGSSKVYTITAVIASILGVIMGQFDVHYIIDIALPALMFIYPVTIILILLNIIPERFTSVLVFRAVVFTTLIFSIPDFLTSIGFTKEMNSILELLPLAGYSLAWLLPASIVFVFVNFWSLYLSKVNSI
ncbi:branched-chain amino acid transport system II carrier protein [Ascidiimonas sp. W6]|uniref:branched-chain amino acid transport system II carrier protein n=1 Tax=Ascidiimonas meishanensis TaxID=3128903 RepID=UPI0030EF076C